MDQDIWRNKKRRPLNYLCSCRPRDDEWNNINIVVLWLTWEHDENYTQINGRNYNYKLFVPKNWSLRNVLISISCWEIQTSMKWKWNDQINEK